MAIVFRGIKVNDRGRVVEAASQLVDRVRKIGVVFQVIHTEKVYSLPHTSGRSDVETMAAMVASEHPNHTLDIQSAKMP